MEPQVRRQGERGSPNKRGKRKAPSSSCRVNCSKNSWRGPGSEERLQRALAGKEGEVDASSLPPLSEQGRLVGCSGPHSFARLPPGAQGGQDALPVWDTPSTLYSYIWGRRAVQGSRPRRAAGLASPRPPVATVLQVPHPCAWRGLGAWGHGERSKAVPSSLGAQPRRSRSASGRVALPGPGPGGRHVATPGARPPGSSGTHSGAAAGPASWGRSGLRAPRPNRSPRLCRASVRPAGSQPSRAGEGKNPAGEIRAPAAAPSRLAAGCPDPGAGRAGTAGAGLPRPPAHWASPGGGGSRPRGTRPCAAGSAAGPAPEAVSPAAPPARQGRS